MYKSSHIKRIFIAFTVMSILILHSWTSYICYYFPYTGIEIRQHTSNQWVISEFYSGGTGEKIGLAIRDEVIRIDNEPVDQHFTVWKWGTIEQAKSIAVNRNGIHLTFETDSQGSGLSPRYFLGFIAEILFIAIAGLLYFKARPSSSVTYLIAGFTLIGLAFMCAEASAREDTMAKFIIYTAMSIIPFLFAHFIIVFLKERGYSTISIRWISYVYIILVLLGVTRLAYFLPISFISIYKSFHIMSLGSFAVGCLFTLWLLTYVFLKKRHENSYPVVIIKTIWISFVLSFAPFLMLSVVPDMVWGTILFDYSYSSFFILLFPVSFTYFVFTNKLFNIDMIVNRILFLFCLAFVPSLIITISMTVFVAAHPTPTQIIISFATVFLVICGVIVLLDKSHQHLTGMLFPGRYRLVNSFNRIINNLRYLKSFEDIQRVLLPDLCDTLGIPSASIRIRSQNDVRMVDCDDMDCDEIESGLSTGQLLTVNYRILRMNEEPGFSSHLILAYKSSGTLFSKEELRCITHFVSYLSIVVENVYLIEKLSLRVNDLLEDLNTSNETIHDITWLRRSVFQLQEKERQRIASDLHDTVMQDLFFAKQRLTSLQSKRFPKINMNEELQELTEYIEIINQNLRETTYQVYPYLLQEMGFSTAIHHLFESQRFDCPFQLHLQIDPLANNDLFEVDFQLLLFRISQELLSNARKHSQATHVSFHFTMDEYHFILEYDDDGVGLNHQVQDTSRIGLTQMKNRIISFSGKIHIKTVEEEGLSIRITIPKPIRGISHAKVH